MNTVELINQREKYKLKGCCGSCYFAGSEPGSFVKCRRHAPIYKDGDYGAFPVMHETEWCGDYKDDIGEPTTNKHA